MRDLGGKPHWAKNFNATPEEIEGMFGDDLLEFRKIRNESDPEGMFVGAWHRRYILGGDEGERLPLEEVEVGRQKRGRGGLTIFGKLREACEGFVSGNGSGNGKADGVDEDEVNGLVVVKH